MYPHQIQFDTRSRELANQMILLDLRSGFRPKPRPARPRRMRRIAARFLLPQRAAA